MAVLHGSPLWRPTSAFGTSRTCRAAARMSALAVSADIAHTHPPTKANECPQIGADDRTPRAPRSSRRREPHARFWRYSEIKLRAPKIAGFDPKRTMEMLPLLDPGAAGGIISEEKKSLAARLFSLGRS